MSLSTIYDAFVRAARSPLFRKYVALFLAVVSIVLLFNALFMVWFAFQENRAGLIRLQREQAESAASKIGQFVREIENQLGWTTQLPWSTAAIEQRRFDGLRLLRQVPAITELVQLDSKGLEQLRVSRLSMDSVGSLADNSKEPKFTAALANKFYYSPIYFRRESEPYMTISMAGSRRDAGVSVAEVNLKFIWDVVSQIKVGQTGQAFVVDAEGRLLAHPDISLVLRKSDLSKFEQVVAARQRPNLPEQERIQVARDLRGQRVLTAHAAIAPTGWLVFVELPEYEANAPLRAALGRSALLLLGGLSLAGLAGLFLARRMLVPIEAMRTGANRIGSGDLEHRISIKTGDELEELANSFNDMAGRLNKSYADLESKIETRTKELTESLEYQTATSEVLGVISRSPNDLQPVLDTLVAAAQRLCDAEDAVILVRDGDAVIPRAHVGPFPWWPDIRQPLSRRWVTGRAVLDGKTVHVPDFEATEEFSEGKAMALRLAGNRAALASPLVRDGVAIGAILMRRLEPRPFTERQIRLLESFADQAVIAMNNARLFEQVQARTAEVTEALEYQTATSEVLNVISRSPNELAPVLDAISTTAARLCKADFAILFRLSGGEAHVAAHNDLSGSPVNGQALVDHLRKNPVPLSRERITGRAILDRMTIHVEDESNDPQWLSSRTAQLSGGQRTILSVPLLSHGEPIGAITLMRKEADKFTVRQIKQVETFADQAVIAINNVGNFEQVQARTAEVTEALEYQTATTEVLDAIARSATETQPVFEAIVASAARLCGAEFSNIVLYDGKRLHIAALNNMNDAVLALFRARYPTPPDRTQIGGRAVLDRAVIRVVDVLADPDYPPAMAKAGGWRSMLGVPLISQGRAIGAIIMAKREAQPYTERQVRLVETFANQAVIAINNVGNFEQVQARTAEVTEALEYQTATSEVLGVLSRSPSDLQPLFQTIVETAVRLCKADKAIIYRLSEGAFWFAASHGNNTPEYLQFERTTPIHPGTGTLVGRTALACAVVQIEDAIADPAYEKKGDAKVESQRAMLGVPLLRDGETIGVIALARSTATAFSARQIDLVTTFANQAVIAINNVGNFEQVQARTAEVTEALETQTATADILRVISQSPTDTQPVFDAIVQACRRLFGGKAVHLAMPKGEMMEPIAYAADDPDRTGVGFLKPWPLDRGSGAGACILDSRVIAVADTDVGAKQFPRMRDLAMALGYRSCLFVPLLREGKAIGSITILRETTGEFNIREIALAQTFADQAVIAIENVRLFEAERTRTKELAESLEYQTAISGVLGVISRSPSELQPVFDSIVESGLKLFPDACVVIAQPDGDVIRAVAIANADLEGVAAMKQRFPIPLSHTYFHGVAILDRKAVDVPDIAASPAEMRAGVQNGLATGFRAQTIVPMMQKGIAIGTLGVFRRTPGPLSDKQLALLKTFADQAVIAIENARLFEAEQTRTRELKESLEYQTATAEVLGVISRSPNDLQPVLDAILATADRLCQPDRAQIWRLQDGRFAMVAQINTDPAIADYLARTPIAVDARTPHGRSVIERRTIHVNDGATDADYADFEHFRVTGARTIAAIPLLRDGVAIGAIALVRTSVRPFTDRQIDLVTTFASQAVIAINNVGNFEQVQARTKELQESLEYQTATSDVLKVISRSKFDLAPVLQSVIDTSARLCRADKGIIYRLHDGAYRFAAGFGQNTPEYLDIERNTPIYPGQGTLIGRIALSHHAVMIEDALADPAYEKKADARIGNVRSMLGVPLLRDGETIGAIALARGKPTAFSPREIELVTTFADQAAIAIENVRLFEQVEARTAEVTEALEYQTATSEVLGVISRSPNELQPVFDAIVTTARRLCGAEYALVCQRSPSGLYPLSAHSGADQSFVEWLQSNPVRPGDGSAVGIVAVEKRTLHLPDALADRRFSDLRRQQRSKARTMLAVPLNNAGEVTGVIFLAHTVVKPFTDRQIELVTTFANQAVIAISNVGLFTEIQEKSRELAIASAHKSQFLANMSHELRTPLNAILGYTELMIDGVYGGLPEKSRQVLDRVQVNGKHLLGLINDVLDLTKIEAGQLTLTLADYEVTSLIDGVVSSTGSLAQTKGLELRTRIAGGLPTARGDERRLKQVLLNLVGNALKFTDKGHVEVAATRVGDHLCLSVADTGPGIAEQDQGKIFEEFQQIDTSSTKEKGGSGLGLAITKRIVEMHGGTIGLMSEVGVGSVFTVTLPLRVAAKQVPHG